MMNNQTERDVKCVNPKNFGWLEVKLNQTEMDYLWKCIEDRKESIKDTLAGNITESNSLVDKDEWFFKNVLMHLCATYGSIYGNLGMEVPTNGIHAYCLHTFWVNFQREHEFNPIHHHGGVYSFVIWMKIPTRHDEQNQNPIAATSNSPRISTFNFQYVNTLGKIENYCYEMNPEMEGTLVFFPAGLNHLVYPFYNCSEERVSISGNIYLDTTRNFNEIQLA